jgi:outer membrane protein OmpA-like peptidoglycan-associated protein
MSFNLIDAAKGLFTNELLGKASSFLGESETGVSKAVGGIIPVVLSGLLNKTSNHEGAGAVAKMVEEQHNSGVLSGLGNFFGNDSGGLLSKGAGLLSGLFGNKTDGITSLISNFSGLKSSSTSSLLSMALPALLGLIGKHATGGASGIASLLSSQKNNISNAIPSGLNLSSVLGNVGGNITSGAKAATTQFANETAEKSGGAMKILLPLLLLAAAAVGAWYLFGNKGEADKSKETITAGVDSAKQATTTGVDTASKMTTNAINTAKESLKVKLADGTEIEAFKGGVEDKLVAFLSTDWKALGADSLKKIWYDFDNLNFDLGKATIAAESMGQVKNLAAILKAYPDAKIKVGGYTDKKGNPEGNKKLSQSRADAVIAALKGLGTNAAQLLGGEGYGSQFATVAAEATDEERRKDRRTAVSIRN